MTLKGDEVAKVSVVGFQSYEFPGRIGLEGGLHDHWKVAFRTPKELASSFKPLVPRNVLQALELTAEKRQGGVHRS